MFTLEEFIVICMILGLALLCSYAITHVALLAILAKIEARRDADEAQLRQDIGNDVITHHGRD